MEANETYMRVKHGFVIPYRDSVADLAGLLSHLQRKITGGDSACGARKFSTLEGVRGHMRDAGHVKIKFEPASVYRGRSALLERSELDDYVPELSEFYDFPTGADALPAATFGLALGGLELCSAAANNSGTGAIGGTTASFVTITSRRVRNRTSVARVWWLWRRDWRRANETNR